MLRYLLLTMVASGVASGVTHGIPTPVIAQEPNVPGTGEKQHAGTVVSAGGGKLVMTSGGGAEHTHMIGTGVTITIDNHAAKLEDLKKGDKVVVTTGPEGNVLTIACQRSGG